MPISDTPFNVNTSSVGELSKLMRILNKSSIDAWFTKDNGKPSLSRDYIEMILKDYAISQQNDQLMSKWLALESKLDKSLMEYLYDLQMLLASITQTGMAQSGLNEPTSAPNEGMGLDSGETGISNHDRELPVNRVER